MRGEISLPGDKSIAHRALIISAVSEGKTAIHNFPLNKDCLLTLNALKKLGARITLNRKICRVTVKGAGLSGLKPAKQPIFVGDSGTTLRLLLGVLAGQQFKTLLKAGNSLSQRPMLRVTQPLKKMGAIIDAIRKAQYARLEEYPPLTIRGGNLRAITYRMPIASAQVKSAILFAGLYADGLTKVIEPVKTRDHTERMLKVFKAGIKLKGNTIVIKGRRELISPKNISIPADISSAAFFMVAAAIIPDSRVTIKNAGLNPSRTGIIKVLNRMGADIQITNYQLSPAYRRAGITNYEPMGDIIVKSSSLKGVKVKSEEIPSLIDELPILMVAACFAKGRTVFEGIAELRVKETDRIRSMSESLKKMGADIAVLREGNLENMIITGPKQLIGAKVKSFADHRTAMSLVIAGMRALGRTAIDDISCIKKSFPGFLGVLRSLQAVPT